MSLKKTTRGTREDYHRQARDVRSPYRQFAKTDFTVAAGHLAFLNSIGLKSPFGYANREEFVRVLVERGFNPATNVMGRRALETYLDYRQD